MTEPVAPVGSTSLERIVPAELRPDEATGMETLKLHVERYKFAQKNLVPGTVVDLACGVGYGTFILAESSDVTKAIGVDISQPAIQYAAGTYRDQKVSYLCMSAQDFSPHEKFDNVVSLETIEHVDDPQSFFSHLVSLIKPGGRLIASVPTTPSVDANPHHKTNFSSREFKRLGASNSLRHVGNILQVQRFDPLTVFSRREKRTSDLRPNIGKFYYHHPSHLALRVWSILRDGFANKYLTVVWEKPSH